ncbi:ZIP family metal transporter [Halonotius terrestris]|uniref:ZIP family metal transporter n=1 Tax=Halonotius terrestris TaxID=2487750 RepID=A0A8J8PD75_9EURY|nr:ZIP family metal transporter [Halonotius terrestris]TQQ83047.1 ZIP family metal transporter [Halonotius terrestris]
MNTNSEARVNNSALGRSRLGLVSVVGLFVLSAAAAAGVQYGIAGINDSVLKVVAIGWVAFGAMVGGAWLGARANETDPLGLVWGYGLASGAMITSAAMFLVPQAIGIAASVGTPQFGGIGLALGVILGYSAHTIGHRLTHLNLPMDVTAAQITIHALSAGAIIGIVYGSMPSLGLLLGLAIVSHKGPAGYAAARRLSRDGRPAAVLLLPAAAVGLTAIPTALLPVPEQPIINALVFGFAAGIFLHVAMDFLPKCETGSEIDQVLSVEEDSHHLLDQLRTHAVASTLLGSVAVVAAWLVVG